MKPSMSLMKMTIRLLLLLILIVTIFLISSLLYSARYWPDIYNYINANITIKRIPTLSELNLTIIEVEAEYVTESYTTTDLEYMEVSTIDDFDIDEFTLEEVEVKNVAKRSIIIEKPKDYIELPSRGIFVDYVFLEEPMTTVNANDELTTVFKKDTVTNIPLVDTKNSNERTILPNREHRKLITTQLDKADSINIATDKIYQAIGVKDLPLIINEHNEKIIELSTTKEGYVVGGAESNIEEFEEITKIFDLTTVTNEENEFDEDFSTRIMMDLFDESKLTTRVSEDVEMFTGRPAKMVREKVESPCQGNKSCEDFTMSVYPWIVAIFVKNGSNNQFSYHCDGTLLSDRVILTDARCVHISNKTLDPDHLLVFLGKGSLQIMNGNEKIQKIKEIKVHNNFTTDSKIQNDLALLVMEETVVLSNTIQTACVQEKNDTSVGVAATTAWGLQGELMPIFFNKEKSENCYDKDDNIFCATYGNDVALCPSYGGVYAVRQTDKWCLQGVFYGDPAERGICFSKNVFYTSLINYTKWIDDVIDINKNDL